MTIHDVEITTPGVVTYGAYSRDVDPYEWWDDETAADVYRSRTVSCTSTSTRACRRGR